MAKRKKLKDLAVGDKFLMMSGKYATITNVEDSEGDVRAKHGNEHGDWSYSHTGFFIGWEEYEKFEHHFVYPYVKKEKKSKKKDTKSKDKKKKQEPKSIWVL